MLENFYKANDATYSSPSGKTITKESNGWVLRESNGDIIDRDRIRLFLAERNGIDFNLGTIIVPNDGSLKTGNFIIDPIIHVCAACAFSFIGRQCPMCSWPRTFNN